jgi:diacylglycerol kinase (ATP)
MQLQVHQGPDVQPETLGDFPLRLHKAAELIVQNSNPWAERSCQLFLMVNPAAGKIHSKRERESFLTEFEKIASTYSGAGEPTILQRDRVHVLASHEPGELVKQAHDSKIQDAMGIFISFGGDGTHQEVLNGLCDRTRAICFARYPMGTGNDGIDIHNPNELAQLIYSAPILPSQPLQAVKVTTAKGEGRLSGNITGIGIDAYIGYLSQKYKRILPGKAYKIAADLGVLFYKRTYNIRTANIQIVNDEYVQNIELSAGVMCFGASGNRTYGGGLPILPGEENICLIPMGSLLDNIKLKKMIFEGSHIHDPKVQIHQGKKMIIDYPGTIPMQMDGEIAWLDSEDFPLTLEVVSLEARLLKLIEPVNHTE